MTRGLPDGVAEIVDRLGAGERIVGPCPVARIARPSGRQVEMRAWTWRSSGRAAHATSINAVLARRLATVQPAPDAENEIVLTERPFADHLRRL